HASAQQDLQADAPMAEIRERHDRVSADAQHVLEHLAGMARSLQRLGKNHVIEGIVGVVDQIGIGVALDHREALGDAFVDALAGSLDAPPVGAAPLREDAQHLAVAATDVEHFGPAFDHVGDEQKIDAGAALRARRVRHREIPRDALEHHHLPGASPRNLPAPSRNPRTMAKNSGSSSRKASWPLSVSISANDTGTPPALRTWTMARDSTVGNSQSLVNEITQKRVRAP